MTTKRSLSVLLLIAIVATLGVVPTAAQDTVTITFWTIENQPARVERQEAMAADFMAENPGVEVEIVPVDENEIDQLMTVNLAAGTNPDVVLQSMHSMAKWANDGAISAEAATEIIAELGIETFSAGALALSEVGEGLYSSVPADGWGSLVLYRQDIFDANDLPAPTDYASLLAAAQALHDPDNGFIGFCGPNAPDQLYTWQIFEWIASANGVSFVDEAGNVTVETPEWIEAIQFYADLMNTAGPSETGWYWDQTRANYFAGNCAMTIWGPWVLDEMAGLRDAALPTCPECEENPAFLTEVTAMVPTLTGYSNDEPVAWGSVTNIGISPNAPEAARDFVMYMLSDGYMSTLGIAPEGKIPMRTGTAENPTEFLDGWALLDVGVDRRAPLSDFFSAEVMDMIVQGADSYSRMGFDEGQSLLASAVGSQFFIQENLVAVIEGQQSAEDAAIEIQIEIEDLQYELEE